MLRRSPKHLPVFVYGTLRKNERYYSEYLEGRVDHVCHGKVDGDLVHYHEGDYPCLIPGEGEVNGEIMMVKQKIWSRLITDLDSLEGYFYYSEAASLFLRRKVLAKRDDGAECLVWAYYWNGDEMPGPKISSGDWTFR